MNYLFYLLAATVLMTACNQNNAPHTENNLVDTVIIENPHHKKESEKQDEIKKRVSFNNVSEMTADSSHSTWVKLEGSSASLALHFDYIDYKDTLAVSYSPECWLMYPYKIEGNKIVVYWDTVIDTKYQFEIVKAIEKTDKKYLGKPFMILELENDTTFKATYPMKELINKINSSSKDRTFFPDQYIIAQDGFL